MCHTEEEQLREDRDRWRGRECAERKGKTGGASFRSHIAVRLLARQPLFCMSVLMCNVKKWTVAVCARCSEVLVVDHACFVSHLTHEGYQHWTRNPGSAD
jgi:hypothetical protein